MVEVYNDLSSTVRYESRANRGTLSRLLHDIKRCSKSGNLEAGKSLHREAVTLKLHANKYLTASLVMMYGKCGSMILAQEVFERMSMKDGVSWNSLIMGYVENGESEKALAVFTNMDCKPNGATFVVTLKACAELASGNTSEKDLILRKGIDIHHQVRESGYDAQVQVSNALILMFSRCGSMQRAQEVFGRMKNRDTVTWNTLVLGYVDNEQSLVAMDMLTCMDCEPSAVTFMAAFKACGRIPTESKLEKVFCVEKGLDLHMKLGKKCIELSDVSLANSLIFMYMKCGESRIGREAFNGLRNRSVVTWNTVITGYVENGKSSLALELFGCMDCDPDTLTYVAALKACGSLELDRSFCLEKLISVHKELKGHGFEFDMVVATTLLDVYGKLGNMHHAREVFNGMRDRNVFTWTSLIAGYVGNGEFLLALELFVRMDCQPNAVTCTSALKAVASLASDKSSNKQLLLEKGVFVHKLVTSHGFVSDVTVATTLVDMYNKCGDVRSAEKIFNAMDSRSVVTWNTLIIGYVLNGRYLQALEAFESMDCEPSSVSYIGAMKACGGLASEKHSSKQAALEKLVSIHTTVIELGLLHADIHLSSTLVDMYSKCGDVDRAKEVFDGMSSRTVVTWSSLISGYVNNWEYLAALGCFLSMDCEASAVTFTSVLQACAGLAALGAGEYIHATVHKLGLEQDPVVGTALVDFYGKCGHMSRAEELFNNMSSPGIVPWTSLIAGYCSLGDSHRVFVLAKRLREAGVEIDSVTSVCLLAACSHTGLVEKAGSYFTSGLEVGGLSLDVEHYNCMVDLLSRANRLEEALALINSMPVHANTVTWMTLLAACREWNNLEVGRVAFDALMNGSSRQQGAAYVLWSALLGKTLLFAGGKKNKKTYRKHAL